MFLCIDGRHAMAVLPASEFISSKKVRRSLGAGEVRLATEDERITFNAGSHEDAIRMSYREFENLVQPQVVPMAKHD